MKSVRDSVNIKDAEAIISKLIDLYLYQSTENNYSEERAEYAGDMMISDILSVTYQYAANNPVLVKGFTKGILKAFDNHKKDEV
jgi:hypothetical protein